MNTTTATLLDLLKYVLPSLVVLAAAYLIVQKFLVSETQRKQLALMHDTQDATIRLRLQAYERLAVFIERIHPRNLVPRVYVSGMTVSDLQQALIFNIRTEFEHNLSQQVYVSRQVWETVKNVKEQEMGMVNQVAQQLSAEAPARDLHARIIDVLVSAEGDIPVDVALQLINDEAKRVLSYGTI